MQPLVEIEDIEALRRRAGIDDVELRVAVRGLRAGDRVRLTLLAGPDDGAGETVLVEIIRRSRSEFRGRLAEQPVSRGLAGVRIGSVVRFTAAHIHSLPERRLPHGP